MFRKIDGKTPSLSCSSGCGFFSCLQYVVEAARCSAMIARFIGYFDDDEFLYQRLDLPSNIVSALEDTAMSFHGRFGHFFV